MTSFDWLVIGVLALSTGFAVIRGGLREFGTLLALAVAAGAALLLLKPLQAIAGIGESFFATLVVAAALIVVGFFLAYWALHMGLRRVRLSSRGLVADRVGGGIFGFLRGLVLIGLGFLAYSYYLDEANRPNAVNNALTLPVANALAGVFESFAPRQEELDSANSETKEEKSQSQSNPAIEGYARNDRAGLAEIVTTVTTSDKTRDAEDESAENASDPIADLLSEGEAE